MEAKAIDSVHVTGDTHVPYDIHKFLLLHKTFDVSKKNYLFIILGDFGLIWKNYKDFREGCWTEWIELQPYTVAFVDGNHENFERINSLPSEKMFGADVGIIGKNILHLRRGRIYTIAGKKFFCFGGAQSIDRHSRKLGVSIWPEETPSYNEMNEGISNLEKHQFSVDYILTHTGPMRITEDYIKTHALILDDPTDPTEKYLDHIFETVNFSHWYFGHWHEDLEISDKITMAYEKFYKVV